MGNSTSTAARLETPRVAPEVTVVDSNGSDLPVCQYRFPIGEIDRYFCRHSNVHTADQLVDSGLCRSCGQRTNECLLPRPAPSLPFVPSARRHEQGPWEYI